MAEPRRIGLIVNPIAGLGGPLAAHGSDHFSGTDIRAYDGRSTAEERAKRALKRLHSRRPDLEIIATSGLMGASAALSAGFSPILLDVRFDRISSAEDTRTAAAAMIRMDIELILFAGGDGTAHDIFDVVGDRVPLVGIPTGVKMHSAVFTLNPEAAGETAAQAMAGRFETRLAEIMDADEAELAAGRPSARLFGYARIPALPRLLQPAKATRPDGDDAAIEAWGRKMAREAKPGQLVILGPGTTMALIKRAFGVEMLGRDASSLFSSAGRRWPEGPDEEAILAPVPVADPLIASLLGADVIVDGKLIAVDADAATLEALCVTHPDILLIVGVVGGQGFVFGRGNQQISPEVLRAVTPANLRIVATREKLLALPAPELRIDTGDIALDRALEGYRRVETGPNDAMVMRLCAGV